MKVVNLVGRDRRSPEQSESYVRKGSGLCRARSPILALHDAIIRCRTAKRDSITPVIGAHAGERTAPSNAPFEVVNMRGLQVYASRLIVAAVLIQPRDGERLGAAVCRRQPLLRSLSRNTPCCGDHCSNRCDRFQEASPITNRARGARWGHFSRLRLIFYTQIQILPHGAAIFRAGGYKRRETTSALSRLPRHLPE